MKGMDHTGTPWHTRAREQFDALLDSIDSEWVARCEASSRTAADQARNQVSETLNQGLRRLREAETLEDAAVLAVEIAVPFASRCAVFLFQDGRASAISARGLGALPLAFSPDAGAAFRTCIETQDPVIAIASESEISKELAARVGSDMSDRVFLLPLRVNREVKSILFATGSVQPAQMELIAGITAIQMESVTSQPIVKRSDLVAIGGVPWSNPQPAAAPQSWIDLTPELQALHLRAQREARLRVAEMRLEHTAALQRGLETSDIYGTLREPIDAARATFRRDFITASPTMVDYLYLELVRGLAHDNDRLLGLQFPGPLV